MDKHTRLKTLARLVLRLEVSSSLVINVNTGKSRWRLPTGTKKGWLRRLHWTNITETVAIKRSLFWPNDRMTHSCYWRHPRRHLSIIYPKTQGVSSYPVTPGHASPADIMTPPITSKLLDTCHLMSVSVMLSRGCHDVRMWHVTSAVCCWHALAILGKMSRRPHQMLGSLHPSWRDWFNINLVYHDNTIISFLQLDLHEAV